MTWVLKQNTKFLELIMKNKNIKLRTTILEVESFITNILINSK